MALASRGLRDMDDGPEAIEDPEERAQVRRQALKVNLKALLPAIVVTVAVYLIPG